MRKYERQKDGENGVNERMMGTKEPRGMGMGDGAGGGFGGAGSKFQLPKWTQRSLLDASRSIRLGNRVYLSVIVVAVLLCMGILIFGLSGKASGSERKAVVSDAEDSVADVYDNSVVDEEVKTKNLNLSEMRYFLSSRPYRKRMDHGVSLIASCHNRIHDMDVALQTWLRVSDVDEIIVVDWSSTDEDAFFASSERTDQLGKKVIFARVDGQKHWILTRAYNLAIALASGKWILKVDCDTLVAPYFLEKHPLADDLFYSLGSARNVNEGKLHGVLLAQRSDLVQVHGYDERLIRYGYEDQDLVKRMSSLQRHDLNPDTLSHLPHNDPDETTDVGSIRKVNKAILENVNSWTAEASSHDIVSKYEFDVQDDAGHGWWIKAKPISAPELLYDVQSNTKNESAIGTASKRVLHDDYDVPWDILTSMPVEDLYDLLLLVYSPLLPRRILFVSAGKSFISVLSAIAAAARMERPLIMSWGGLDQDGDMHDLWDLTTTNEKIALDNGAGQLYTVIFNLVKWNCQDKQLSQCVHTDTVYSRIEAFLPGMGHLRDPPLQHMFIPASVENPFILEEETDRVELLNETRKNEDGDETKQQYDLNISYVLSNWLVPSLNVKRMLRSYKDYVGATCALGPRGISKLAKAKDTIVGNVFVFGTESTSKIEFLGKEAKVVGGACTGARHCTQRRVADQYAVLLCARVFDDSEPGDTTMQRMWTAYEYWRNQGRYHFDVK